MDRKIIARKIFVYVCIFGTVFIGSKYFEGEVQSISELLPWVLIVFFIAGIVSSLVEAFIYGYREFKKM